jgi:serine/threonine protein phosphatase PrpC
LLRAHGVTDKGRIRPTNEDCFIVSETLQLCVVADGMGGHQAGEVAARIAVDVVADFVADAHAREIPTLVQHPFGVDRSLSDAGNIIRTAIQLANIQVLEAARTVEKYAGMGTTIVAALVVDDHLAVGHVGDSRLYVLIDGRLRQLTRDDSWVASVLAEDPAANPALLQHHPMRNALTNAVGARPATDVHIVEERLTGRELLLLTTDGVHGVLDEDTLERLLRDDTAPLAGLPDAVVRAALAHGSRDNCTACAARYTRDG